jgi:hypothetical protein
MTNCFYIDPYLNAQVNAHVPFTWFTIGTRYVAQVIELPDGTVLHKTGEKVCVEKRGKNYSDPIEQLKFIIESKGLRFGQEPNEQEWAASWAVREKMDQLRKNVNYFVSNIYCLIVYD